MALFNITTANGGSHIVEADTLRDAARGEDGWIETQGGKLIPVHAVMEVVPHDPAAGEAQKSRQTVRAPRLGVRKTYL